MNGNLKLVINNKGVKKEKFFIKKELQSILNLYAKKVSSGDWKDYGLTINRREISFDVYQRVSEKPLFRISKNLNPKNKSHKYYIFNQRGIIIKKSDDIDTLIKKIEWSKLKLVK